jgi:hypothetical protein
MFNNNAKMFPTIKILFFYVPKVLVQAAMITREIN